MKKVLAMVMTMVMVGSLAMAVSAATINQGSNSKNGTATVTATVAENTSTYTVSIPETIDFGSYTHVTASETFDKEFSVSVSDVTYLYGKKISVAVSGSGDSGAFVMKNGEATLAYKVLNSAGNEVTVNGTLAEFTASGEQKCKLQLDKSATSVAGSYSGTLTFAVSVA